MNNFQFASEELGFETKLFEIKAENGILKNFFFLIKLVIKNKGYFFIRYNNSLNFLFLLPIIILKISNKKLILDVPTPIVNYIRELFISDASIFKKILIFLNTIILGPIPFILASLNVQYSKEGLFFSLFTKSILIGNGIDTTYYIKEYYKKEK